MFLYFVFFQFIDRNRYINNTVLERTDGKNAVLQLYRRCMVLGSQEVRCFWTKPAPCYSSMLTVPYCWHTVVLKWARGCIQKWSKWPAGLWAYPPSWYTSKRPAPTKWPTRRRPPAVSALTSTGWLFSWVYVYASPRKPGFFFFRRGGDDNLWCSGGLTRIAHKFGTQMPWPSGVYHLVFCSKFHTKNNFNICLRPTPT